MDITSIEFGILSPEEVISQSVCEIKVDKQKKLTDLDNTLYDPRMGPVEDDIICPTCKKTMIDCPGHFGHIILNAHIIHPLPYAFKTAMNFLKCFCSNCSRFLFTSEKLELLNLTHTMGLKRYEALVTFVEKIEICWSCRSRVARYHSQGTDIPVIMTYYKTTGDKGKEDNVEMTVSEIERIFQGIKDEDIEMFGFNPRRMRPKNLIISILPVMPTCSRPYVISAGEKCEDDLTTMYRDICKHNAKILLANDPSERNEEIRSMIFYISSMMYNHKGRVKQPNGRAKKGIRERLSGKPGIPRGNLLGKRTNFSGRTVVGGDPTLEADQVAVPDCIASRVTYPESVCAFNLEKLSSLVNSDQAEFVIRTDLNGVKRKIKLSTVCHTKSTPLYLGDKVYRQTTEIISTQYDPSKWLDFKEEKDSVTGKKEVFIEEISHLKSGDTIKRTDGTLVTVETSFRKQFKLQLGDLVHRHLQDGDWIIINRQPTLHVGSILGARVKRQKIRRSIGIPLNDTTPQNCDFDGDEINMHVPQTLEARAEYMELISVRGNITSGQSSRPIMGIVQDCLVGSYLMTQGWVDIAENRFNDICMAAELDTSRFDRIRQLYQQFFPVLTKTRLEQYLKIHSKEKAEKLSSLLYTGRGLFSLCLPQHFYYRLHNKANDQEPVLQVKAGVLISGSIDKAAVGPRSGAMHHFMNQRDGLTFLTKVQRTVNNWFRGEGFGVGIGDCFPIGADQNGMLPSVKEAINKAYTKAKIAETTQSNLAIAEIKVNSSLNGARDITASLAKLELRPNNRFMPLIQSGSKGSMANVTQIVRLLGQQNVEGKRMELNCIEGKRSLPHYREEEDDPDRIYESRGFIRHSFFTGLNPQEFWFHATSGREGIINTAVSTAKTGYCQRRITEMLKNVTVEYDCTVRDSTGRIIQFIYGGDGLSPSKQQRIDGVLQCHIGTSIEEINTEYELELFERDQSLEKKDRLSSFKEDHSLSLTLEKNKDEEPELPSPINSGGSEIGTPETPGSVGSVDRDFDD